MSDHPLRLGVWALVHGSRAALHDPEEPYDASFARNRALVLEAEALGFDSVLVAQHTINPHDPTLDQLEAWTASAALAALTSRIEIIAAIKPMLYHPVVLAKMALGIHEISHGRFAINLVNAWNRPEIERAGIVFADHDARYAYGSEWLDVVRRLLEGERVNHAGDNFRIENYELRPAAAASTRPRIYLGGESEPARALAAAASDAWFINGQPRGAVRALIEDVAGRPRAGPALRYGLSAFVIARETEHEAQNAYRRLLGLAEQDEALRAAQRANTDQAVVMKHVMAQREHVGTNGGTAAGLVGSYDQVASRIREFHASGVELFMLQFQPFEREMRRFAAEIMPRLPRG